MVDKKEGLSKESSTKEEGTETWKSKLSHKFVMILAIVSILGFAGIVSETIFNRDIHIYVQALWMIAIGAGMIAEAQIKSLRNIPQEGLTPNNFTHLITTVIGMITIVAGILSFPRFNIANPSFHAIRGIISIIAIVVIVVQTWLVE
jgi:hypothetical protein